MSKQNLYLYSVATDEDIQSHCSLTYSLFAYIYCFLYHAFHYEKHDSNYRPNNLETILTNTEKDTCPLIDQYSKLYY